MSEHTDSINCLTLSATTNQLFSGAEDGSIRIWDTRTYKSIGCFEPFKDKVQNIIRTMGKHLEQLSPSELLIVLIYNIFLCVTVIKSTHTRQMDRKHCPR